MSRHWFASLWKKESASKHTRTHSLFSLEAGIEWMTGEKNRNAMKWCGKISSTEISFETHTHTHREIAPDLSRFPSTFIHSLTRSILCTSCIVSFWLPFAFSRTIGLKILNLLINGVINKFCCRRCCCCCCRCCWFNFMFDNLIWWCVSRCDSFRFISNWFHGLYVCMQPFFNSNNFID